MKDETQLRGWIILSCTHKMRISPRRWRQSTSILYSKEWKEVKNFMDEWQKSFSIRKTYKNWCFCFFFIFMVASVQNRQQKKKKVWSIPAIFFLYVCEGKTLTQEGKEGAVSISLWAVFFCKNWKFSFVVSAKKVSWNINQHKFTSHSNILVYWILESI